MSNNPETTPGKQNGKWVKGVSGNPKGRPRGARNQATLAAERLLDGQAEALTQAAIDRALEGDSVALRLCLERILPPRKDRPVPMPLPAVKTIADVLTGLSTLLTMVGRGAIPPTDAGTVAGLLMSFAKTKELSELEARLQALENAIATEVH